MLLTEPKQKNADESRTRCGRKKRQGMFENTENVITDGGEGTRLVDAMYSRAKEFPVTSRNEAIATLVEAAGETAALADVLLMLASVTDGDMRDALMHCSKKASSATMNTIRAVRFLARKRNH